ncbi:MAG: alpha-galactosidase [Clostridia bacterium]|nr:alpha-galactosidase [Clostridia bacterium]
MPIIFDSEKKIFKLDTLSSSYIFKIYDENYLVHLYYGAKIPDYNLTDFEDRRMYASFSASNPNLLRTGFSADVYPLEIGCNGCGDMRIASLQIRNADGNASTDMRYVSHKIYAGKPALKGLPALYANEDSECMTLEITTRDKVTGAEAILIYTVFEKHSALTRSVIIRNTSEKPFTIEKVMSFNLDLIGKDFDLITLYGRHNNERNFERRALAHGRQGIGSRRGSSSAQQNPFMALLRHGATEEYGDAYGFNLVYSCNHLCEIEVDFNESSRIMMGIDPSDFGWLLSPGEEFYSPEAVLVYSNEGLGGMSRTFHKLYNNNLVRGQWKKAKRPLLINNWEGTYFDFDDDKLFNIAKWAKDIGIEMLVMDDGWFGLRNDDRCALGDWTVNENKLRGGIGSLISRIKGLGLKFGIWYEPEMISPDSDLYRAHPDWCIHVPNRDRSQGRWQYVIDMSRQDVRDYLFDKMSEVLAHNDIDYVKWDFNRNITEAGSALLPPERQKEFFHRFILGTYELMDRLTKTYPHLLLENCSGGGGRYDPGMMYFSPQIWCSDNTDALSRVDIQFGSSLCYPASVQGAHVSASSRSGYETKRNVAMWGSFGYELDPAKISKEASEEIRTQIADYHKYYDLIHYGDLYRIISPWEDPYKVAWEFVSEDKSQAMLTVVVKFFKEARNFFIKLKGLDPEKFYKCDHNGEVYSGALLMNAGLSMYHLPDGDGESYVIHLEEVK